VRHKASQVVTFSQTATPLADGAYIGQLSGNTATLTISGGQPTEFSVADYSPEVIFRDGNKIRIDQSTLTMSSVTNGTIKGIWERLGRTEFVEFKQK